MNIIFIVIGVLWLITLWLAADYTLGRKRHLAQFSRRTFPIRDSNIEIFTKGPELFDDLFYELKTAAHHIHILFYIVKNDKFSKEFFAILTEKAKAGVEIRLLVDWLGSRKIPRKTRQDLVQAGGRFAYCHIPKLPYLFYSSQVRNHRKITVIDGKTGYLGGFNIGKEYIDKDPKLSPWRDYHLKLTGEGVSDLQREFLTDWRIADKTEVLHNSSYFPALPKGSIRHQIIPSEGFFLEETFSGLIQKAERSIVIGSPYFIPSQRVFSDLKKALNRGVSVTILVPYITDHLLVKEASFVYLRTLVKGGAEIYEYMKGFYHAKVLLVDDSICDIGTANFDKRSLFLNHEINCYIFDRDFIDTVKGILQKDILDAKKLTMGDMYRQGVWGSVKELTARSISHFL